VTKGLTAHVPGAHVDSSLLQLGKPDLHEADFANRTMTENLRSCAGPEPPVRATGNRADPRETAVHAASVSAVALDLIPRVRAAEQSRVIDYDAPRQPAERQQRAIKQAVPHT
jgi:hypothetical protein